MSAMVAVVALLVVVVANGSRDTTLVLESAWWLASVLTVSALL